MAKKQGPIGLTLEVILTSVVIALILAGMIIGGTRLYKNYIYEQYYYWDNYTIQQMEEIHDPNFLAKYGNIKLYYDIHTHQVYQNGSVFFDNSIQTVYYTPTGMYTPKNWAKYQAKKYRAQINNIDEYEVWRDKKYGKQ